MDGQQSQLVTSPVEKIPRAPMPERAALPQILLAEDVARVLGLPSANSALDLMKKHRVPHMPLGKRKYWYRSTFLKFMRGLETSLTDEPFTRRKLSSEETEELIRTALPSRARPPRNHPA